MINLFDVHKIIAPIKRKIMLLIGRCILSAIKNTEGTQKIQVVGLKNETITGIERYQEYGLETYPKKDSEVLILFLNGDREQGVAVCIHDRRYRPKNLSEGDVCLYDYRGQAIILNSSGIKMLNGSSSFVKGETLQTNLNTDKTAMQTLQTAISTWVPVPNDGGAALKVALAAFLALPMADYSQILSTKIKGE